ncbi:MAG: tetratricopeptide repeat protein [Prosthecobacter sp.]
MIPRLILCFLAAALLAPAADNKRAAELWQQSVTAEASGDYATAFQNVLDFKSAGGDTYLAAVRAGWLSYLAKDYEKAIQFYSTAAKTEKKAVTPWLGLAHTYLAQEKVEDVLRATRSGLLIDASNREMLLIAGELTFNKGEYRQAERLFQKAVETKPEDPIALSWLGWSLIAQGELKPAAKIFESLMALNPNGYLVSDGYALTHGAPGGPGGPGGGPPPGAPPRR